MSYVVLDFETTGLNHLTDQVIEIAALKLDDNFEEIGTFHTLIRLEVMQSLPEFIAGLTGITDSDLEDGMFEEEALGSLISFIGHSTVVAQYAPFDLAFLEGFSMPRNGYICTKSLSLLIEPEESSSLGDVCERLGIGLENAHRALDDVRATAEVLKIRLAQAKELGITPTNVLCISPDRPLRFIPPTTDKITLKGGGVLVDYTLNKAEYYGD